MKKSIILTLFIAVFAVSAFSQNTVKKTENKKDSFDIVQIYIDSVTGDTMFYYKFEEVVIKDFQTPEQRAEYAKLKRNVKKVLPYAKLAAFRIQLMEDNLAMISDPKAKEKYIKETEKAIKDEFMETMKNFSRSQGLLMIKLIHRETGKTTYEILKGYRGSTETFYWSMFAKMYGADIKMEYDPIVDYQIDLIIRSLNME
ncbi:MAG: DUF4294 domain-containing protein [Flavobacteriales bacterium]|nr:DUF4294 domain-containing protein [Flavobacteriales bacterium]